MDIAPYWYAVLWLLAFGIGFGILFILSRDPYFNPHKGWMALISIAGGFQLVTSVFAGVTAYNFLIPIQPFAYSAIGAIFVFVVVSLIWIWFNIRAFV